MNKICIEYNNINKIVEFEGDKSVYEILLDEGIPVNSPCGGKGTCEKCRVMVDGSLQIACTTAAKDNMTVLVDAEKGAVIMESGVEIALQPDDTGYGVAIDIGTTTIVAYLYQMETGCRKQVTAQLNAQRPWGADVIVRTEQSEKMHQVITQQIDNILEDFKVPIKKVCIAGNTIMMHFLLGLDARPIAVAPFTPQTVEMHVVKGSEIGLRYDGEVIALPSIAGYVGADIVAGVLAGGIYSSEKQSLLIDIGTNGEIAVGNRDGVATCATAAGPAFEGANISCGVGGVPGAINKVWLQNGTIKFTTIQDAPPIGLCGSGLIDAAAILIEQEIIDETGYMEADFTVCEGVVLTPRDIRELQLAKASICAGVNTILYKKGLSTEDIETVYIAGGFGSYMDSESAIKIGLLPKMLRDRIKVIGNAAGSGAIMALLSGKYRQICKDIAESAQYIELSGDLYFQNEYVNQMMF